MSRAADSLVLVQPSPSGSDEAPSRAFCSHCGRAPQEDAAVAARVCGSCGMGLVLHAPADVAPAPGAAFLVIDPSLSVGAVSRAAERFLAVQEADVVHRPVSELIAGADSEPVGGDLGSAIASASTGEQAPREVSVRPANTFGVRCRARIGPCGPPRAAVIVLDAA